MAHVLRRQVILLALLAVPAGCAQDTADEFPTPTPGSMDGGPGGRTVVDVPARPDLVIAPDGGMPADSAPADAAGATVTLVIVKPTAGAAMPVRSYEGLIPEATVTIDVPAGAMADTVTDITATLGGDLLLTGGPSIKLNATNIERPPESRTTIFHYGETPMNLGSLASGEYELTVSVTTLGKVKVERTVLFLIDAGPQIRIESPKENDSKKSHAVIDVSVSDPLFGPILPQNIVMTLGQTKLNFATTGVGTYTTDVVFNEYMPPLQGQLAVTVEATNSKGTSAKLTRRFSADDQGPLITGASPKEGDLIGKVITISAQVSDTAGVDPNTVVAVVAHGNSSYQVKLQPAPAGSMLPAGTYLAAFDTTQLPVTALFPSISFRARDTLGNESSFGYLVSLDNTPPMADLDPPANLRLAKVGELGRLHCSHQFDPLGSDAIDDLDTVGQLFDVRARIQDQGNSPADGSTPDFTPISQIDETKVQLLILDDTSQPLVVDTDGDGGTCTVGAPCACDSINPLLTPTTAPVSGASYALVINMIPVPVGGGADFTLDTLVPYPVGCDVGIDTSPPAFLCATTNLTVAMSYSTSTKSAIWTLSPVVSDGLQCAGRQFDALANNISNGWACLAVAVTDKLGNASVSRPIRICVNRDGTGSACTLPAPDCTGTVTSKPGLTPIVVNKALPCKPWRLYQDAEVFR
jgi:hypothetical protein